MCGIAGIISDQSRPLGRVLGRMTENLAHRGPDGQGFTALRPGCPLDAPADLTPPTNSAQVFLGHRRLAIIDLAGSRQPLRNEDGSIWVVFNGEIYNYHELAAELTQKGHTLREKGDTEVLVHLYEEYGPDLAERLNGMFALAIYDTRTDTLLLARDRYGEKPLFYFQVGDLFAFASELQGLWPMPGFPFDTVDPVAAAQYFRYGYVPSPRTIYAAVSALPPGHVLIRRAGQNGVRSYYIPRVTGRMHAWDPEELAWRLDAAVASRLMADVPLGCFLSGGLDSSLVASTMARVGAGPVKAFTIAMGADGGEATTAGRIAGHLGAEHAVRRVEPDFVAVSGILARHFGQPFADISAVPTYLVSRETRQAVTVALSGDGGDELFAGYERYANYRTNTLIAILPGQVRASLAGLCARIPLASGFRVALADFMASANRLPVKGENHSSLYYKMMRDRCFTPEFAALAASGEADVARFSAHFAKTGAPDPVSRWMEVDQRMYLADDILTKVDVASMAVSLETRAPLLDHEFAGFANDLALGTKLSGRTGKLPLRALAARRLPSEVASLPKRGFTIPLAHWLRGPLRDWGESLVRDHRRHWEPYLRPAAVMALWDEHQSGVADHAMRLWLVMAFGLWTQALPGVSGGQA